ncbi:hypothetical protein OS493_005517 [Desmophyllum pertusum]|uniref:polyribonucleotide nucleotidyltransferase n=1 Tax=Desmophyllum pertusum TaxID=174260 RepID=A0A9W9YSF2_9CNID|nr:hypothetical protein OS493_005517 [Desmophyllum pertusum]
MAKLADGAIVAEHGNNSTLVTAVSDIKNSTDNNRKGFLPLMVDYKEKSAAGGHIPRTFLRKDIGTSERETIISRRIDRSLRSLFHKDYSYSTQIMGTLWAADGLHDPDIAAMNGASAALTVSGIPWSGPIGVVRVGEVDGEFLINPTWSELNTSRLNLVVACSEKKVVMVEACAQEVSSERFCEALRFGFKECQPIIKALRDLQSQAGKMKRTCPVLDTPVELLEAVQRLSVEPLDEIFSNFSYSKMERDREMFAVRDSCSAAVQKQFPDVPANLIEDTVFEVTKSVFRRNVLEKDQRCDGREFDALRPIECEVDLFKSLHGSSLFQRGETQVFCTATLGSLNSARQLDTAVGDVKEKRFMLHYEFPPFCVNEIGLVFRSTRREIGHGNLAEMALEPVVPKDFPFTVRLTTQVLESNGSSSLASVCAGSLALMDADSLLSQCLSRDWTLGTLSLVMSLLTPITRHSVILKRLCSQSDDCILLKIYQGWIFRPDDVPAVHYREVHLQIVGFVNNLFKNSDSSILLFPVESDCHCSLELIKCLVLMLNKVLNSLGQLPSESLTKCALNSPSLMLLRQGVFLLSTLCLNDRLFVEHRVEVEHQYINVVSSVTRLYKQIAGLISEAEVLAVQELVDFEHIEGIEWSQESEDEEDETVEGMDVVE